MTFHLALALRGTPAWAFALFAYLLWVGLNRLTPGVRKVIRVWITPIIFIFWGVISPLEQSGSSFAPLLHWLLACALGVGLGALADVPVQVDRCQSLVWQPGSVVPLVRNMAIFGGHYYLNVAAVMNPPWAHRLMGWDVYVSGISAGYFVGWAIRFAQSYRRAQHVDLSGGGAPAPAIPR